MSLGMTVPIRFPALAPDRITAPWQLHCSLCFPNIGVARGPAGPAMAGPLFSWLYTNPMEQYSLAGPVVYYQLVWPDHFSARYDAPAKQGVEYCLPK